MVQEEPLPGCLCYYWSSWHSGQPQHQMDNTSKCQESLRMWKLGPGLGRTSWTRFFLGWYLAPLSLCCWCCWVTFVSGFWISWVLGAMKCQRTLGLQLGWCLLDHQSYNRMSQVIVIHFNGQLRVIKCQGQFQESTRRISIGSSSYSGKVRDMYGTGKGREREE